MKSPGFPEPGFQGGTVRCRNLVPAGRPSGADSGLMVEETGNCAQDDDGEGGPSWCLCVLNSPQQNCSVLRLSCFLYRILIILFVTCGQLY